MRSYLLAVASIALIFLVSSSSTQAAEPPIGQVGDRSITETELVDLARGSLREVEEKRYQILEQELDRWIAQELLELEAAELGIEVEALIEREISSKVQVTDEQVEAFYSANQGRIQGDRNAALPQVRSYLEQQRSAEVYQSVVSALRTKYGAESKLEPFRVEIASEGAMKHGPEGARVTLVEFSDFECPYCRRIAPAVERLKADFPDDLRVEFRQYPLRTIHPRAQKAAEASLCAGDQGEFWAMHDALLTGGLEPREILEAARNIGLDSERFEVCLEDGLHRDDVQSDFDLGLSIGVASTPSLFVNGRPVRIQRGSDPYEVMASLIREELDALE